MREIKVMKFTTAVLKHAKVLIYLLIDKAKKNIDIVSSRLDKKCYGDERIKQVLKEKLSNKVRIRCIYKDEKAELPEIFKNIECNYKDLNNKHDFMVVDKKAYRFEEPHSEDIDNVAAKASFNDKEVSNILNKFFEENFNGNSNSSKERARST